MKNAEGYTALIKAALHGYESIVQCLIENKAKLDLQMQTVYIKHENIVKMLIDPNADVNKRSEDGKTALVYAISWGNENIVRLIVA